MARVTDRTEGAALHCLGFGSSYQLDCVIIVAIDFLAFTRKWFSIERGDGLDDRGGLGHGPTSSKDVAELRLRAWLWWKRVPGGRPRE